MKTFLSVAALAFASAVSLQAQTVLWNGEDYDLGSKGGCWDDGNPAVVENPETDGINTSAKCLAFTMTNESKVVKIPFRDWIQPNMEGSRRISLMIKKTTNENVKIEISDPTNGAPGYWEKVAAWYGNAGSWQKVVFDFSTNANLNDFPGVISITAQTGDVPASQTVYIDNVVIEPAAKIGDVLLKDIPDGSLAGHVTVTGALMKGDCQNANGDWVRVDYNDFATLDSKLGVDITSVDIRGTILKEAYNPARSKNANVLVFADAAFGENEENNANVNVIVGGNTAMLELNEAYPFAAPENFQAASVKVIRQTYTGTNTFCLPFYVGAELGGNLATFKNQTAEEALFDVVDYVDANIPFLATGLSASESLAFTDKGIVATPETLGTDYVGSYKPVSGNGLYGIGADNTFIKGGEGATLYAFHAYLQASEGSGSKNIVFNGATNIATISTASAADDSIYTITGVKTSGRLEKGIYIMNKKKIMVR